jgi:lysophospholipase L1-like esterase
VVVVAGLVAVPGCALFDDREPVAIIGDSITWGAASRIDPVLGRQWRVDVRAVPGATIGDMVETAGWMGRRAPQQLVVNLGSNDVMKGVPIEQSVADFEQLLDQFPTVSCVHLVTINNAMYNQVEGYYYTEGSLATNAALAEAASRRGVDIVDWNKALADAEASGGPPMLIDTVHPTDAGVELLVSLYGEALEQGCEQLSGTS